MKRFYLILLLALGLPGLSAAEPDLDNALTVQVARKTVDEAMGAIAEDIGALRGEFPQLKKWKEASVSAKEIAYRYHYSEEAGFEKNGCNLRITSKDRPDLGELKVGIYLKFSATGDRAEALKQKVQGIVAKHFEKIRSLRFAHTIH